MELKLWDKTDNELMQLAAEDDRDAFAALVLRYYKEVLRFLTGRTQNPEASQDIAQDCFADIWASRRRYRTDFSFRTYLYAVLKHKLIDYIRRSGKEITDLEIMETHGALEDSPEALFLKKEQKNEMAEWIATLPPEQKKALLLYAAEGMSYQEIANAMQKNVRQIKSAIHRARMTLKRRRDGR